jgi:spore germination protein
MDDQIFQLIDNDHYLKLLPIPELSTTIGNVRSNVHMELDGKYSSISIKIDLNGRLEEYRGVKNILRNDELAILNKEIESYLEKQTTKLLKKNARVESGSSAIRKILTYPLYEANQ